MAADVLLDGVDVLGKAEAVGLAGLGGDVADVRLDSRRGGERAADAFDEQVGEDAGIEAAGPQNDHVCVQDGAYGLGMGGGVLRLEEDLLDTALRLRVANAGLTRDGLCIIRLGAEGDVGQR